MSRGNLRISQLLFLLASACGLHGQDFDKMVDSLLDKSIPFIQPDSLQKLKNSQANIIILDAREKEEFEVSHLSGAQWVGYDDFDLSSLDIDKNKKVVVYCSVGYRSEKVGEELEEAGYDVSNLYGGIFNWKNSGYEVVDNQDHETEKVHAYSKSWGKWLKKGEKVYE